MNYRLLIFLTVAVVSLMACEGKRNVSDDELESYKEPLVKVNKILVDKDAERIGDYCNRHKLNLDTTRSGLWYKIISGEKGDSAVKGKVAYIKYKVSLLDGTTCYTSDSLGVKTFLIGQGGVETGLEIGILLMKSGDKAIFILTPNLGHGLIGDEKCIPPRSIIRYDVELIKVGNS
jgi:FKBP-type peptidyl-prolyl cis-trans isomerase FkpA